MSQARLDLLRPPAHRGPLIAAGAVVLAVGVVLAELRLGDAVGVVVHALITGVAAAVILGIGLQAVGQGGRPPAYQSVLIVTGLLLLEVFLLRLADALGADFNEGGSGARDTLVWSTLPPGTAVWTSLVLAGVAGWAAFSRRSAVALLIAALAVGLALLAAIAWIFDADSQGPYRFLLLVQHAALPNIRTAPTSPAVIFRALIARAIEQGEIPAQNPSLAASMVVGAIIQPALSLIYGSIAGTMCDFAPAVASACSALLRAPQSTTALAR